MLRPALHEIGATPIGRRRVAVVVGGSFEGPRLRGEVLPEAGADWLLVRPDRSLLLDVRITLKTDDGAFIYMTYRGIRQGQYFRTAPFFETGDERYAWLNDIVSVGVGEQLSNGVRYDVFEIL